MGPPLAGYREITTFPSMIKKVLIGLVLVLGLIQFIQPKRNTTSNNTKAVYLKHTITSEVSGLLKSSCLDCHSNSTRYPWYAKVQPIAWWMAYHVNEGKAHLNFSEFVNHSAAYQYHKFEEIIEMVQEKEMPLPSYTWFGLHPEAKLTDEQRGVLTTWARTNLDAMEKNFPPDSLIWKRK